MRYGAHRLAMLLSFYDDRGMICRHDGNRGIEWCRWGEGGMMDGEGVEGEERGEGRILEEGVSMTVVVRGGVWRAAKTGSFACHQWVRMGGEYAEGGLGAVDRETYGV